MFVLVRFYSHLDPPNTIGTGNTDHQSIQVSPEEEV